LRRPRTHEQEGRADRNDLIIAFLVATAAVIPWPAGSGIGALSAGGRTGQFDLPLVKWLRRTWRLKEVQLGHPMLAAPVDASADCRSVLKIALGPNKSSFPVTKFRS
jgi:hypothetical protein